MHDVIYYSMMCGFQNTVSFAKETDSAVKSWSKSSNTYLWRMQQLKRRGSVCGETKMRMDEKWSTRRKCTSEKPIRCLERTPSFRHQPTPPESIPLRGDRLQPRPPARANASARRHNDSQPVIDNSLIAMISSYCVTKLLRQIQKLETRVAVDSCYVCPAHMVASLTTGDSNERN